jgi:hypothetical protein
MPDELTAGSPRRPSEWGPLLPADIRTMAVVLGPLTFVYGVRDAYCAVGRTEKWWILGIQVGGRGLSNEDFETLIHPRFPEAAINGAHYRQIRLRRATPEEEECFPKFIGWHDA